MRKTPGSYQHGDLRNAILQGALAHLRREPADSISLRELAEQAGVSPRAPYVHFPAKRDLLIALADHGFQELAVLSEKAGYDLFALGEVYVSFALENPHLFRLMFGGTATPEECPDSGRSFQHVLNAIRHHHPRLSDEEVHQGGIALWAFVHGLADLRIQGLVREADLRTLALRFGAITRF